ncbi:MAG TPA: PP2C family protein-serine/threonine phosphatase [Acidobacteriaceae bacterium]|nr:PP2C family protein-serine/threonine phosphatase [Acidobacteriaceae bacterium]
MRIVRLVFLLGPLLVSSHGTGWAQGAPTASTEIVTLGNSAVALTGPWKFSPGDSPWVNGSPVRAQPGFDDAHWATMDLTPQAGSVDLNNGTAGFVPGWTQRGYPDLSGYAWYRLRLRVRNADQPLWLEMPLNVDDGYQVYANGHYVGQFGGFSAHHVSLYYTQPLSFPLPAPVPDGEIELAVRFYMSPATRFNSPDVGGMHGPPALGLASTVHLLQAADDDANLHGFFGGLLRAFLFLLIAPLALWAWLRNRQERMYLWLFLALACTILSSLVQVLASLSFALTIAIDTLLGTVLFNPLTLSLWIMFWWHWFGLRERRWIPRTAWLLTAARMLADYCADSPNFGLSLVPQAALHWCNAASLWCVAALGVLLVVILIEGFRRDRIEALLALVPILLLEFASFGVYLLTTFHIPNTFFPFGLGISVNNIASMLMMLVIGALALRRFVRTQVGQEVTRKAIALDLEQAHQLQQRVLVPEVLISPFFTVEAEYRPAQTVGGDFFQTLTRPDGSLLVVIGDVSGKGVSAAMLVAVLVGAIRNQAEYSFDPAAMLTMLNRRLLGRSGGHFATCLAAEILPDGTMRLANAGHMPTYRNGKEMELEGSLPLGLSSEATSSAQTFTLDPGDRITFLTDGVVEAMNPASELFGFARAQQISGQTAISIAQQAQSFGQNDDITVLGVEFTGATAREGALMAVPG